MLIFSDLPDPFTNVKLAHVLLYLEQIFSISVYNKLLTVSSLRVMPSTETTAIDLTKKHRVKKLEVCVLQHS